MGFASLGPLRAAGVHSATGAQLPVETGGRAAGGDRGRGVLQRVDPLFHAARCAEQRVRSAQVRCAAASVAGAGIGGAINSGPINSGPISGAVRYGR
jgi:hypothetical protein